MKRVAAQDLSEAFLKSKIARVEFVDLGEGAWRWIFILDDSSVIMLPVHPTCPVDLGKKSDSEFVQLMTQTVQVERSRLDVATQKIKKLME